MFFLTGVAHSLFVPMAEAVVFAMLASYLLSRTLVPTLVMYMMSGHHPLHAHNEVRSDNVKLSVFKQIHLTFERGFEHFGYQLNAGQTRARLPYFSIMS
jgi:Cu/Ag efflux pump CusA